MVPAPDGDEPDQESAAANVALLPQGRLQNWHRPCKRQHGLAAPWRAAWAAALSASGLSAVAIAAWQRLSTGRRAAHSRPPLSRAGEGLIQLQALPSQALPPPTLLPTQKPFPATPLFPSLEPLEPLPPPPPPANTGARASDPYAGLRGGDLLGAPRFTPPWEVGSTVGDVHGWRAFNRFSSTQDAFAALDRNGDGVLTFQGDGLGKLGNLTLRVTFPQFEEYFKTEHVKMVSEQALQEPKAMTAISHIDALQTDARLRADLHAAPPPQPRDMELRGGSEGTRQRLVEELYTFGSPGTAPSFLYDATREGGCIRGLRVFSRAARYTQTYGMYFEINDPVSWLTAAFNYDHPKMTTLQALEDNDLNNPISPCTDAYATVVQLPSRDDFWWMGGHLAYESILRAHANAADAAPSPRSLGAIPQATVGGNLSASLRRAHLMSHFAFTNYQPYPQLLAVEAPDWGWILAGRSCGRSDGGPMDPRCSDHVALYQHEKTLECVLAFEGTADFLDFIADIEIFTEDFCSFGPVHSGFKYKLMRMLKGVDYKQVIQSKLPMCNGVTVTGHSLGAAQAELFVACANKGVREDEDGFEDYRHVYFEKATPRRLSAFFSDQAQGVFLKNKGNGLCIDVRGTMGTLYEEDVILFDCELPDSQYSKDQRWQLASGGYLVNDLSGQCMDVDGETPTVDGVMLLQRPCQFGVADSTQRWEMTPEGFIKHLHTGKCVNSGLALYPCPYSDQLWSLAPDGHLVNTLSGKCLDVVGAPGMEEGADIVLWPCEYTATTDQRWELTSHGALRNRLSLKCLNVRNEQGRENHPALVLATCKPEVPGADLLWELTPQGFLRNRQNGKCIDVEGSPGTTDGARVALLTCEDGGTDTSGLWTLMLGGFIRNRGNDYAVQHRCIEIVGEPGTDQKLASGARLITTVCKVNTDQKWEITHGGFIQNVIGGRKCIDIKNFPAPHYDELWLKNCEQPDDPVQHQDTKWGLLPDGKLKHLHSLQCLDVEGTPDLGDGAVVKLGQCEDEEGTYQRWQLDLDGFVVNRLSSKCLDVRSKPATPGGATVVLGPCERGLPGTEQQWDLTPEGFLRNRLSGRCVGPGGQGLVLRPCAATTQRWWLKPGGLIQNSITGQCLDARRPDSTGVAWKLVAWACEAARTFQQWELVPAGPPAIVA